MTAAVPILIYHTVTDDPPAWIAPYAVTPAAFRAQMDAVVDAGLDAITVSQFVDATAGRCPMPARPALITFDDGFVDTLTRAGPILAERRLAATVYVTAGAMPDRAGGRPTRLGPARMLAGGQLPQLEQLGFEVGSHSLSHPPLDVVARAEAWTEIAESKVILEDALSHRVRTFAYPHGFYDRYLMATAATVGYDSAVAVRNALSSPTDERMALARLMVMASTPLPVVRSWLDGKGAPVAPFPVALRTRAWRVYRRSAEWFRSGPGGRRRGPRIEHRPPATADGPGSIN